MTRIPAPISTAEVTAALEGRGRLLPQAAYVDPDVFEWELRHLFEDSWVCLGRASVIDRPGDQTAVRVGRETVLLVRHADGMLRAFFNVCRHRSHELVAVGECVNRPAIKCPYHAWVYGLDGNLRGAPRFEDLERDQYPLVAVRVHEWNGWIFVNVSGDASEFAEHTGNLDQLIAGHECTRLVPAARHDYEVAANWKILTENYHECYHCSNIHPELCKVTPPDSGVDDISEGAWVGGTMTLRDSAQTMSLSGKSLGVPMRNLDAVRRREVLYYNLTPNLLLSLHPDYVMTHVLEPIAPDRTRVVCEWLWPPEALERDGFDPSYATEFWDITNREDWSACESVQRGVSSRAFSPGPLSRWEDTTRRFIAMVARSYLDGELAPPPMPAPWSPVREDLHREVPRGPI